MSEIRPPKAVKTTELEDGTIRYDYADGSYGIEDSRAGTLTIYADGQVNTYEKIADSDYRLVSSDIGTSISYFDEEGNMTESELAGGARYRYTENGFIREEGGAVEEVENGERTRVKDSLGNDFHYDSDGNLTDETQTVRCEVELPEPVSVSVEVEGNIPRRNKMVYEDGTYGYEDLSTGDVTIHCGDSEEVYKKQENGKYILKEEKDPDRRVEYHDNGYPKQVEYNDEKDGKVVEIYRKDGRMEAKYNEKGEAWQYNGKGRCVYHRHRLEEGEKGKDFQKDDCYRDTYYYDDGTKKSSRRIALDANGKEYVTKKTDYYPNGNVKEDIQNYPDDLEGGIYTHHETYYENGNIKTCKTNGFDVEFYDNGQIKEITSNGKFKGRTRLNSNGDIEWSTDDKYDYTKIKHQEFDRDGNLIKEERFEKENENENSTKTGSDNETRPSPKDEDQKESKPAQKTKTEPSNSKLPPIDVSKAKSNSLGYSGEENQGDYLAADGDKAKSGRELRRENPEERRAERRERNLAKIEELRQKRAERNGGTSTPIENYAETKERDKADNNTYAMRWKAMQSQNG